MKKVFSWLQSIDLSKQSVRFNTKINENTRISSKGSTMGGIITLVLICFLATSTIFRLSKMMNGDLDSYDVKEKPARINYYLWHILRN